MKREAVSPLPIGLGHRSRIIGSTLLLLAVLIGSACGSTDSRQQPGLGTGGHPGGTSGHGGGGATGSGGAGGKGTGGGAGGSSGTGGAAMLGTPCSKNQDCGIGFVLMCRAPGEFLGCGACQQDRGNCASDTDCAADAGTAGGKLICDPPPSTNCFCPGTRICLTGCRAKTDCPSGQNCNYNHQCQNTCVPGDGTCPVDFVCGTDGFCGRTSCAADTACSGACVKGLCYSTRGSCEYTPI